MTLLGRPCQIAAAVSMVLLVGLCLVPLPSASAGPAAMESSRLQVDVHDTLLKVKGRSVIKVAVTADNVAATGIVLKFTGLSKGLRFAHTRLKVGTLGGDRTTVVRMVVSGTKGSPVRNKVKVTATASNAATKTGSANLIALSPGSTPRSGSWQFAYSQGSNLKFRINNKGTRLTGLHGVVSLNCYSIYPPYVSVQPTAISVPSLKIDKSGRVAKEVTRTYRTSGARARVTSTVAAQFTGNQTKVAYLDIRSWVPASSSSCYMDGVYLKGRRQ